MRVFNQRLGQARRLRAILLASSALCLAPFFAALPAAAQDATWSTTPGSGDFNNAANWSPAAVPTGTAFFGTSGVTALSFSASTTLGGLTFNPGASAYTFTNPDNNVVTFNGAGIVVNGGSATITNNYYIQFTTNGTAGNATFVNKSNSGISLFNSTLGNATVTNGSGASLQITIASSAGDATITNDGFVQFQVSSTAANATITNNADMSFQSNSTGGNAAITNGASGTTDFSRSTGPLGDNKLSAGSLAGGGTFSLGQNELTVGGNNLSTNVTGVIADGGFAGGTGASLVKTGTGTMTLSGINTYTGATTVDGGALNISGSIASSTITNNANLAYIGSATAGNAGITNNNGGNLGFANTSTAGTATITNNNGGNLSFYDSSTAANANITNNSSGNLSFNGASTAGSAGITNNGNVNFYNTSSAGSATVTNNGNMLFANASTAGSATLTNTNDLQFRNTSTAGNAKITSNSSLQFAETASAGSATIVNNLNLSFFNSSTAGNATITNNAFMFFNNTSSAGNATIINNTFMEVEHNSTLANANFTTSAGSITQFLNASSAGSATITNNGQLQFWANTTGGNAAITNGAPGSVDLSNAIGPLGDHKFSVGSIGGGGTFSLGQNELTVGGNNFSTNVTGVIADGGSQGGAGASLVKTGSGTMTLSGANTYTGGTTFAAGAISVSSDANLGDAAGGLTFNGGALQVTGTTFNATARTIIWGAGGGTFDIANAANNFTVSQTLNGGQLTKSGAGTLTLAAANTLTNGLTVNGGTLNLGAVTQTTGALTLAGGTIANGTLTSTAFNTQSGTISAVLAGGGAVTQSGSGTTTLSGINTYTGATTVNGGTLAVNGSILASSGVTVNAGGTLGGNGIVGNTTINGGALAPGNSIGLLTVQGNLVLTAASSYMIEVSPSNADRVNVTGTATLGGATVKASFAAGTYVAKQYTVLNATGGLGGSSFGSVVNTNLPSGFKTSLSFDANNAYLDLALAFIAPPNTGLSGNQSGVGNALVNYFNRNGGIPLVYGGFTATGLTQASGEIATGGQQTAFNAMTQFMGMMTDPFSAGRGGTAPGASPFADESNASAYASTAKGRAARDTYAMFAKAPLAQGYDPRWSVWASGFGGSQTTDGNAAAGSNTSTSRIFGVGAGADYRFSPNTIAGFALAGGGTNFSVAGGGSGRSDLFQAGGFVRHTVGSTYLSGALAYGWQDVTTNRTVMADQLQARFNASTFSGRFEGGHRIVTSWLGGLGLTPYAAVQYTAIALPGYGETATVGSNAFALSYSAKTVSDTRSELGLRTDKSFAVGDAMLTLRGRAAWAHDFNPARAASPTFIALPGASFVVNGAAGAKDAALTTASAEIRFLSGISLAATFEGEFSQVTRSYAGKGVARYEW